MEKDLAIQKIHTVFEGEFNPGQLENAKGRHSDAFCIYLYGKAKYNFDAYSFTVSAGDVFFLAKGSKYSIEVFEKTKYVCVDFDFSTCDTIRQSCLFSGISSSVRNDFSKLFRICHSNDPIRTPLVFSVLYSIYYEGLKTQNANYSRSCELFSIMTAYIIDNYADPDLSVSDLVRLTGISDVHIRRIFKANANTTPIHYINFIRLEQAENMLKSSNFTITEIAESVGFTDPFYFSRLFKRSFGISPTDLRKNK